MSYRKTAALAFEAAVVVFIAAMLLGQALGQPVLLGYVTSGSMQPTLDPGDGFVAIPAAVAGPVEVGDVIVFEAEELHGGGLTTHRVVGRTDRGYVTKGDANPFTDQDGDEPPVKRAQIVAVAWQVNGEVVVVPEVGTLVTGSRAVLSTVQRRLAILLGTRALLGPQGLAYLLFATTAVLYVVTGYRDRNSRRRERRRSRATGTDARLVVAGLAAVIVVAATAAMVVPAGTERFGVVSAETDSPGVRVIEQGTTESTVHPVGNGGFLPVVVFLEPASDGIDVTPRELVVPGRSVANATLTLSAPAETGYYRRFLVGHRYLAVLPRAHIRVLYHLHPWLPLLVIDALLGGAFYLLGITLVGTGRVRTRSRDAPSHLGRLWRRYT